MKTVAKVVAVLAGMFVLLAIGVHIGIGAVYAAKDFRVRWGAARERTD